MYICNKECCKLKISKYNPPVTNEYTRRRKKAGVFIYDPNSDKVLLVQSRGKFWGPPKGGMNPCETERICAVREVKEETGLDIEMNDFTKATKIQNKAIYFYIEKNECEVNVQIDMIDNDANGIGWIKLECLSRSIENGELNLSKHGHIVFKKFLNKDF